MKRSRNDEQIVRPKNDLTVTSPCKKKAKLVLCLFDWLPAELVEQILEAVPSELDVITRSVCKAWCRTIGRRWRKSEASPYVSMGWAVQQHAFPLVHWLSSAMKREPHYPWISLWINKACTTGNIKTLKWLLSKKPPKFLWRSLSVDHVKLVARHGGLECYKFILPRAARTWPTNDDVYQACQGGQLDIVKWIADTEKFDWRTKMSIYPAFQVCMFRACLGGHIDVVDWIMATRSNKKPIIFIGNRELGSDLIEAALKNGHLKMAQHLVNHYKGSFDGMDLFKAALSRGDVEAIRWVYDVVPRHQLEEGRMNPTMFVFNRQFEVLNLLSEKGMLPIDANLFIDAIRQDEQDLVMVQWLWDRCAQEVIKKEMCQMGSIGFPYICKEALWAGHLDLLDWLQKRGLGCDSARNVFLVPTFVEGLARRSKSQAKYRLIYPVRNNGREPVMGRNWDGRLTTSERANGITVGNYEYTGILISKTGNHGRGAKASLVWLHQRGLVDLSQARVLHSGKIWFHAACDHEAKHDCQDRLDHFHKFKLANTPWFEGQATGEYLIARRARKYNK